MKIKTIIAFLFLITLFGFFILKGIGKSTEVPPVTTNPSVEPSELESLLIAYDSLLQAEMDSSGTVGAAVAIVYKNRIEFLKCYGVKKAGENDSIDPHTIFRLASVSKTVTGVLAGILSNDSIINLDDKVVDYLHGLKLKNASNTNNLSIRNILSHTSGLAPHAFDNLAESKMPLNKIMRHLDEVEISANPGKMYSYQNVVYSLFDTLAAAKTSMPYGELMYKKLFLPFHMNNASTSFESFVNNGNVAYPHRNRRDGYQPAKLNDGYYSTISAAGVNASISDMAMFMLQILRTDSLSLDTNVVNTIFTPQVNTPLNRHYFKEWDHIDSKQYGIGWRIIGYKGQKLAYHGGFIDGYRAEIALCREKHIGIVFLTNSPGKVATISVPAFLNMFFARNNESNTFAKR